MSNTDSFIDEVTEEVRRERLFGFLRRYGWIAVLAVVLIVGGAAYNEWRNASERAEAQAFGDALLDALEADSPEARRTALRDVPAEGTQAAVVAMLAASGTADGTDAPGLAADDLRAVADDSAIPQIYRDLATLKLVMRRQGEMAADEVRTTLEPLIIPGAPYRVLALEQIALADVAAGETDAAIAGLREILEEDSASQGLRRRASQLIVALGGTLEQS